MGYTGGIQGEYRGLTGGLQGEYRGYRRCQPLASALLEACIMGQEAFDPDIYRSAGLEGGGGLRRARTEVEQMGWFHNYLAPSMSNVFELAKGARVRHFWPRP